MYINWEIFVINKNYVCVLNFCVKYFRNWSPHYLNNFHVFYFRDFGFL